MPESTNPIAVSSAARTASLHEFVKGFQDAEFKSLAIMATPALIMGSLRHLARKGRR
jgi:hypothetical protein